MIAYSTSKKPQKLVSSLGSLRSEVLQVIFWFFCLFSLFSTLEISAASCTDYEYKTKSEACHPAWYGATESGAFYTIAIPKNWEGFYTGKVKEKPSLGPFADFILSNGFAMAASSYSQTGWAVFDSHISNGELHQQFLSTVSELKKLAPEKLYIIGGSMGGIVTLRDLESDNIPSPNGALLLCGANAGSINWSTVV